MTHWLLQITLESSETIWRWWTYLWRKMSHDRQYLLKVIGIIYHLKLKHLPKNVIRASKIRQWNLGVLCLLSSKLFSFCCFSLVYLSRYIGFTVSWTNGELKNKRALLFKVNSYSMMSFEDRNAVRLLDAFVCV